MVMHGMAWHSMARRGTASHLGHNTTAQAVVATTYLLPLCLLPDVAGASATSKSSTPPLHHPAAHPALPPQVQRELSELQDKLKPLQMRYGCVPAWLCCGVGGGVEWCYAEWLPAAQTARAVLPSAGCCDTPASTAGRAHPLCCRQEKALLDEIKGLAKKKEELQIRLEQAQNRMDLAM